MLQRIRTVRGLSEHEKLLFAWSRDATPDERWRLHENFLRSHDLYTRSSRKKYGFLDRPKDLAHLPLLKQTMAFERHERRRGP